MHLPPSGGLRGAVPGVHGHHAYDPRHATIGHSHMFSPMHATDPRLRDERVAATGVPPVGVSIAIGSASHRAPPTAVPVSTAAGGSTLTTSMGPSTTILPATVSPAPAQSAHTQATEERSEEHPHGGGYLHGDSGTRPVAGRSQEYLDEKEKITIETEVETQTGAVATETSLADASAAEVPVVDSETVSGDSSAPRRRELPKYTERTLQFLGSACEVRCAETEAFYEAYIIDWLPRTRKVLVAYANGWKPTAEVLLSDVRSRFGYERVASDWKPAVGDSVECQAKADLSEPFGHWKATVKADESIMHPHVVGGVFRVSFDGWDHSGGERDQMVERQKLRPVTGGSGADDEEEDGDDEGYRHWNGAQMAPLSLRRHSIAVPSLLNTKDCSEVMLAEIRSLRRKYADVLLHLGYWPPIIQKTGTGTLSATTKRIEGKIVFVTRMAAAKSKATANANLRKKKEIETVCNYLIEVVSRMHRKMAVDLKLFEREREYQTELARLGSAKRHSFTFARRFSKFMIGHSGEKLQFVKEHFKEGQIIEISIVDAPSSGSPTAALPPATGSSEALGVCTIFGTTERVCKEAAEMLDLTEGFIQVPIILIPEFLGRRGSNVRQIEERTRVIHIQSWERHCRTLGVSATAAPSSEAPTDAAAATGGPPVMSSRRRKLAAATTAAAAVDESGGRRMPPMAAHSTLEEATEKFVIFGPKTNVAIASQMVAVELDTCRRRKELTALSQSFARELQETTNQNGEIVRTFYFDDDSVADARRKGGAQPKARSKAAPPKAPVFAGRRRPLHSATHSTKPSPTTKRYVRKDAVQQ